MTLSENAKRVLEARYLRRDQRFRIIETPEGMFERVARAVADAEPLWGGDRNGWAERYHQLMASLDFLPNSPTLMNAGTSLGQLSACFVIPVEDTMEGIFDALKEMALVQRTGGGTGFSFSRLRPKGDFVASTAGWASGPVSFMKVFDSATENIKQGGRRRGANMGVLRVDHPDIMEFIEAKRDETNLSNFNISVGATDAFMHAVLRGDDYALVHPATGQAVRKLHAPTVFDSTAQAAWQTGDPGILFLDTINRDNPTPHLGTIEATNPCGEVPLLPHEACNLGSINLVNMLTVRDGRAAFDWPRLAIVVRDAVRFLDDVIEVNSYPIPAIERMTKGNRKIGLGVMGFADILIRLGIPFGSLEALETAISLARFMNEEALKASIGLAAERGPFPFWKGSVFEWKGQQVRNATRLAIAPTGTISMIAGVSPSIEPLFALAYRRRNVLGGQTLLEVHPLFLEQVKRQGLDPDDAVTQILEKGNVREVEGVPLPMKRLFATALDIPVDQHLGIQAAFQREVDNSVSKTINMPVEATEQEVGRAYQLAWKLGLKGVTVYRYGSKQGQVLQLGAHEQVYEYSHAAKCDPTECRL